MYPTGIWRPHPLYIRGLIPMVVTIRSSSEHFNWALCTTMYVMRSTWTPVDTDDMKNYRERIRCCRLQMGCGRSYGRLSRTTHRPWCWTNVLLHPQTNGEQWSCSSLLAYCPQHCGNLRRVCARISFNWYLYWYRLDGWRSVLNGSPEVRTWTLRTHFTSGCISLWVLCSSIDLWLVTEYISTQFITVYERHVRVILKAHRCLLTMPRIAGSSSLCGSCTTLTIISLALSVLVKLPPEPSLSNTTNLV